MTMPADIQTIGPWNAQNPRWSAALDDSLHARAIAVVREIPRAIPEPGSESTKAASVADGSAGHALFYAYAIRSGLFEQERDDLQDQMTAHLQLAVDKIQDVANYPFLFQGLAGVGWVANHLHALGLQDEVEDLCDAVDAALIDWLQHHDASRLGIAPDYVYDQEEVDAYVRTMRETFGEEQADRFTGRFAPPETFVPLTVRLMELGYSERDLGNILGGNWYRVAKQVWK